MDDGKQRKDNAPIWSQTKVVAYLAGVIALTVAGAYVLKYGFQTHGPTKDWFGLATGAFFVLVGVSEISGGEALANYMWIKRSEAPLHYWLVVLSVLVLGAALIVFSVGDIFGIAVIERFAH